MANPLMELSPSENLVLNLAPEKPSLDAAQENGNIDGVINCQSEQKCVTQHVAHGPIPLVQTPQPSLNQVNPSSSVLVMQNSQASIYQTMDIFNSQTVINTAQPTIVQEPIQNVSQTNIVTSQNNTMATVPSQPFLLQNFPTLMPGVQQLHFQNSNILQTQGGQLLYNPVNQSCQIVQQGALINNNILQQNAQQQNTQQITQQNMQQIQQQIQQLQQQNNTQQLQQQFQLIQQQNAQQNMQQLNSQSNTQQITAQQNVQQLNAQQHNTQQPSTCYVVNDVQQTSSNLEKDSTINISSAESLNFQSILSSSASNINNAAFNNGQPISNFQFTNQPTQNIPQQTNHTNIFNGQFFTAQDSSRTNQIEYLTANTFQAGQMVTNMPQIQFVQTGPNQYIQQQCLPQQYMLQPIQAQLPTIQNNGESKVPQAILPALSTSQTNNQTIRLSTNNLQVKGTATVAPFVGQNHQRGQVAQQKTQPLFIGALGILPNQLQLQQQQNIYSINQQTNQQRPTLNLNGQLRCFAPNFINASQLLTSPNGAVLNLGQFQVNSNLLVANQGGGQTLLGSQPLYIRAATDAYNNATIIQHVAPTPHIKNVANIAPHQPMVNHVTPQPRKEKSTTKSTPKTSTPKLQPIAKCSAVVTMTTTSQNSSPTTSQLVTLVASVAATETSIVTDVSTPIKDIVSSITAPVVDSCIVSTTTITKAVATVCSEPIRSAPIIIVQPSVQESESDKSFEVDSAVKNLLLVTPEKNIIQHEDFKIDSDFCETPTPIKIIKNYGKSKRLKHKKPKILTHIIEGFIIQEAMEPFPVDRSQMFGQYLSETPKKKKVPTATLR